MDCLYKEVCERIELAIGRLETISDEELMCKNSRGASLKEYFDKVSSFILYVYDVLNTLEEACDRETLEKINEKLYEDILGENYKTSYGNPSYAVEKLGKDYGKLLSFLYAEVRGIISYAYENKQIEFIATIELFLEIYSMFNQEELPDKKYVKEAIYYHMYDYTDVFLANRIVETITVDNDFAKKIIMDSDLSDISYLYKYGEYIGENEIGTAQYLNSINEDKVKAMAKTYVYGFLKGFETMRIDIKPKKTVNIRYSIGQEKMIRYAIRMFEEYGLKPIIFRYPVSRLNRRLTNRVGYIGTPANKQYEYDHRMDEACFLNKSIVERKLEVIADTYEKHKEDARVYAGPAVIETFGDNPFKPDIDENCLRLSKKQQEVSVEYLTKNANIVNKYIPRDKYSFTIIAYPIPEIGDNFEEIFDEIVRVNTLDNELYKDIQQSIISVLDKAKYIHVLGMNNNKTDIKVMLHNIDITKETNFENCLADVNIPLGEVFTSPVLTGTEGVLNVSQVYLNDLKYINLTIKFEDGMIKEYTCENFENEEENKAFIKENIMFNHDTLPIGEFAIGTNTTAYAVAHKFDILYKLPILIVEKMGPHFAVGDTCYSYSEEAVLYNPDGREIVAKENECSLLRKSENTEDMKKAYYNCHTDITIPYEEIGGIYAVTESGERIAIIENGRFVLEGTEKLNKPLETI